MRSHRPDSPTVEDQPISELQEAVLGLLEDADIPTEVNDQIMKLIDAAERDKWPADDPMCET